MRDSGADYVIDHRCSPVVESVLDLTNGAGATIVMEVCGGAMLRNAMRYTAFDGRIVVTGFSSFEIPTLNPIHLLLKGISALRTLNAKEAIAFICRHEHTSKVTIKTRS